MMGSSLIFVPHATARTPQPRRSHAMRGYGQFCPVAIASEIFAERSTPLVVRELFCGSRRFNELVIGLPRIPRSVLVQRLRTLESSGVVERRVDETGRNVEYHLTPA